MPKNTVSGENVLRLARKHVGQKYVLGVAVPKNNPQWTGPWDCAEFLSWIIYQAAGILYGCNKVSGDPATAEAYTGYWQADVVKRGIKVSVERAARTPGAAVLRIPQAGASGHIVVSDGSGGTVEAHSTKRGVIESTLANRRWDTGVLVPGVLYKEGSERVDVAPPQGEIYRLTRVRMTGPKVKLIQRALKEAGFDPGGIDGEFGPMTQAAVVAFQVSRGLVSDGEVGSRTAKALGIGT